MQQRAIVLIVIALMMTACNLGVDAPPQTPTLDPEATDEVDPNSKPTVEIISPSNGAEYVVDDEVLLSVRAVDPIGVTRVQLFANDQIVKTVSSESLEGDRIFNAVLDYVPRSDGEVLLRVLAYREGIVSDPAEIRVIIRQQQSQVIATQPINNNPNIPQIPNDGVCRALTNVNLNFRQTPTTEEDNIITVLQGGTLAPVIGRLGDNSWLQLNFNNSIGWVSADFTSLYGNCLSVPVETVATATRSTD